MSKPIEDHGVIGDLRTAALVGMDGAIDFLCFPRFDSPTIFASLLDPVRGGSFELAPILDGAQVKQLYLPDSAVLLTRFLSEDGIAEISDFMPIYAKGHAHDVVRRVKTVRGSMRYRMVCAPRFDYGRARHRLQRGDGELLFLPEGTGRSGLRLRATVPMTEHDGDAIAEFTLATGEVAAFVLEEAVEGRDSPSAHPDYVAEAFKETVNYWRRWMQRCTYAGRWGETVRRSALTLKLLTCEPYGSLVAAPTFALPERIGGARNWDYRYTWIRDSAFTVSSLMHLGFTDEAASFMRWLGERCAELGQDGMLHVMYRSDGRPAPDEVELSHLAGYRDSRPVRIGNGAHAQLQLDMYGALLDAVYLYDRYGGPVSYDMWTSLAHVLDWVAANWQRSDHGIWEVRGGEQEFLLSRVMCWVALDRGLRLALKRSLPAPIEHWRATRDTIYQHVFREFWDPRRGAFLQRRGHLGLDASALLMPMMEFVGPTDPRWLSTLRAIEEDLVADTLVRRYRLGEAAPDGFEGEEGSFTVCSFWLAECLARAGDVRQARLFFEKMLGYANHLGLYAEELGPRGEHLGNFPQALTHLGLISAAFQIDQSLSARGMAE